MENPKCPYCGKEMEYYWDNNPMKPEGWYFCPKCHSQAPTAKTDEEAYAAAMKRDRAKGEWIPDPKIYIEDLEKAILQEIVRTKEYRSSSFDSDREIGRESAETLLKLSQAWNLLTQRGVE